MELDSELFLETQAGKSRRQPESVVPGPKEGHAAEKSSQRVN